MLTKLLVVLSIAGAALSLAAWGYLLYVTVRCYLSLPASKRPYTDFTNQDDQL